MRIGKGGTAMKVRPAGVRVWFDRRSLSLKNRAVKLSGNLLIYLIFVAIAFMILFPLFEKATVLFKSEADLLDNTVKYIAKEPSFDIFRRTVGAIDYWGTLGRSLLLSLTVSVLEVLSSTFIAYGFARFKFAGRSLLFGLVIFTLIIPPQVLMSSMYLNFRYFDFLGIVSLIRGEGLNMINTVTPFLIMAVTGLGIKNGLYIYMLRQFFRNLPTEFEEAAYIDGAGVYRTFFTVMLPNARTIMASVFLFAFSWQWTDSNITPLLLQDYLTIPGALASLETYQRNILQPVVRSAMIDSAILLAIAPLIVLFICGQRFFVQGIERSGIVG